MAIQSTVLRLGPRRPRRPADGRGIRRGGIRRALEVRAQSRGDWSSCRREGPGHDQIVRSRSAITWGPTGWPTLTASSKSSRGLGPRRGRHGPHRRHRRLPRRPTIGHQPPGTRPRADVRDRRAPTGNPASEITSRSGMSIADLGVLEYVVVDRKRASGDRLHGGPSSIPQDASCARRDVYASPLLPGLAIPLAGIL